MEIEMDDTTEFNQLHAYAKESEQNEGLATFFRSIGARVRHALTEKNVRKATLILEWLVCRCSHYGMEGLLKTYHGIQCVNTGGGVGGIVTLATFPLCVDANATLLLFQDYCRAVVPSREQVHRVCELMSFSICSSHVPYHAPLTWKT
jgi:hypothetical protein